MTYMAATWTATASERRFFLWLSLAIAATVSFGFGREFVLGWTKWGDLPIQLQLHALAFSGWTVLYVVQNVLVDRAALATHRRLGGFGAALIAALVPLAILVTMLSLQSGHVPPFFPPNIFLVLNTLGALELGGLLVAGIALRARPDWHRRLMACGTVVVMAPALGRILPMPAFGAFAPVVLTLAMLAYVAAGMMFDLAARGRVHRAWWIGAGVILAVQIAIGPIAFSPPVRALTAHLMTGK